MKHKLLLSISLFSSIVGYSQTIANGGFENWNSSIYEYPQYFWMNSNMDALNENLPLNTLKVTDPQQGTYAVKMTTETNGVDTLFGYIVNGDPNSGSGGIPYNQHPTTLTGFYKNNIMVGDTAIIFIAFKQNGTIVSQDMAKFTGVHAAYTAFSITLNIPALATPDSVIIGAASSNAFVSSGIPGSMFQLDNLSFTGVSSQPADLNGSFENWISSTLYTPVQWATVADTLYRTTNSYSGTYALELRTTDGGSPGNSQGSYATNGIFPPHQGPVGGRPFALMNDTLCGYYKYTAMGTDSGGASIQTSALHVPVGGGWFTFPPAVGYTFFSIPISSMSMPDTMLIVFSSTTGNITSSNVGSVLQLDNLYLKSSPLGIAPENPWNTFGLVQLYPNPSNGESWLEFTSNNNEDVVMTISDESGRKISEEKISGTGSHRQHIDTSSMDKGVYFITLLQNEKSVSRKLIVQ